MRKRIRAAAWAATAVAVFAAPMAAQSTAPVTEPQRSLFTWRDAVLAAAYVGGTFAIHPLDKRAALALQEPNRQSNRVFRRAATFVREVAQPGAMVIGVSMYTAGRLSHNERMASLGLHGTEALVIGAATGTVLKDIFGRARPFVDTISPNPDDWQILRGFRTSERYRSFPSGHTTAAFAAAAAVTAETSQWWPVATTFLIGPAMYGGAVAVGLSRMYDNRHWASDVIMGAAIGTFAGNKVVRYTRLHPKNRVDRWLLNANWTPGSGHIGLSVTPMLGQGRVARP
jgi:membrane-associated phospholipid phosphatase